MATKRKVEVFSAGCPTCKEAVEAVKEAACSSCEVIECELVPSLREKRDCKTREEFDSFVADYMEE